MSKVTLSRLIFVFTALMATFGSVFSQTNPAKPTPTPDDDDVIKVESRLIVVPASVTDTNGLPVLGLTTADFRLLEENSGQTIDRVSTAENVPLEIALLFDISATTSPMFKFQQETAAKFLQEVLRPNDRATIFTIGAKPVLIQGRDNVERSIAAVRSIVPTKEWTAFYDSVGSAAEYLGKNSPEGTRRVILVISDGEDTNSVRIAKAIQDGYRKVGEKINSIDNKALYQLTVNNRNQASIQERARVLRLLQNADTVFYSINPAGSSFQLNKMSVFGQENMQKFADDTGGTAFLPKFQPIDTKDEYQNGNNERKNTETLERIFRQLGNELRSQYLIQYYSESDFPVNKFVKLEVGLQNSTGRRIRARQGYFVKN
ncbi:MAG: VWA domain-containing protein [Pyrinomonadaceae bacterium]|nr:VWA domain-containing protein [Pyrinomonadaceae bacterium]MBP6212626.1 VWA domain-containing protein [Pyrinomonadaceae bacterium]